MRKPAAIRARSCAMPMRTSLARAGVDTLELPTDADLGDSILSFVDARRQRSRLAAGAMPLHNRARRSA